MKKYFVLALAVLFLLCSGCAAEKPQPDGAPDDGRIEATVMRVAALKGPTAMGLVKLMDDEALSSGFQKYDFSLAASADEVTSLLIKGELDAICVPANLASILWNKTGGDVSVLAINTLGVLYVVENGESVHSLTDLRGKTVVAAGKGSTPEYVLRYLLAQNGIDAERDVTLVWKSEHSECVSALATGAATIALLPQPFVTVAQGKLTGLRTALDLTAEWDRLETGSALLTGVVVARRAFVEEHPDAVAAFLDEYAASVDWVNANTADAAERIGAHDIVTAAVAEQALPQCNIVCITGDAMQEKLSGYLEVLYEQAPETVGGKLPDGDFYFGT